MKLARFEANSLAFALFGVHKACSLSFKLAPGCAITKTTMCFGEGVAMLAPAATACAILRHMQLKSIQTTGLSRQFNFASRK